MSSLPSTTFQSQSRSRCLRLVARYGLHATPYEQIANWAFVDWMLNFREETIQSTIKIRQAGFADCIDTHQSFRRQLTRLRDLRIIP